MFKNIKINRLKICSECVQKHIQSICIFIFFYWQKTHFSMPSMCFLDKKNVRYKINAMLTLKKKTKKRSKMCSILLFFRKLRHFFQTQTFLKSMHYYYYSPLLSHYENDQFLFKIGVHDEIYKFWNFTSIGRFFIFLPFSSWM